MISREALRATPTNIKNIKPKTTPKLEIMAAMLKVSLGLSVLGFLMTVVTSPANASRKSLVSLGGKSDVANVQTNMEIQELGRYCVDQFNLQEQGEKGNIASISKTDTAVSSPLMFSQVVSAQKKVLVGMKYFLRIEVTQHDGSRTMFDSIVVIQPWLHSKKLIGFTPVATNLITSQNT